MSKYPSSFLVEFSCNWRIWFSDRHVKLSFLKNNLMFWTRIRDLRNVLEMLKMIFPTEWWGRLKVSQVRKAFYWTGRLLWTNGLVGKSHIMLRIQIYSAALSMNQLGKKMWITAGRLIGPRGWVLVEAALNRERWAMSVSYPRATDQDVSLLHESDNLGVCECLSARVCVCVCVDSISRRREVSALRDTEVSWWSRRQFRCWCCVGVTPGWLLLPPMNLFTSKFILLAAPSLACITSFKLNGVKSLN